MATKKRTTTARTPAKRAATSRGRNAASAKNGRRSVAKTNSRATARRAPVTRRSTRRPTPARTTKRGLSYRFLKRKPGQTVWEWLEEIGNSIPEEELANFPRDGAANVDHYLYGWPKQDE